MTNLNNLKSLQAQYESAQQMLQLSTLKQVESDS